MSEIVALGDDAPSPSIDLAGLRAVATAEPPPVAGPEPAPAPKRSAGRRSAYFPALDGLRALAVGAVVAYHANLTWAKGGFLGVDVFFVLSGFLITGVLLADVERTGHLQLRRFWRRRARRLLPAVGVLLVAVALLVPLLAPDEGHRLGGDLLAAIAYVTNWRLIFQHQSYFEAIGRPPLLQHLWSLAVEEQFYLLWPLVLAVALRWNRRRELLGAWALGLAGISTLIMILLYDPSVDPSRVYYGTDTRIAAIFVGAALACVSKAWAGKRWVSGPKRKLRLEIAGVVSLGILVWCVANVSQFDARLYRGGFLLVALAAVVVVAVGADRQRTVVARVLGMRPLVWLGKRSYAIYLWFWPVFMLSRPHADVDLSGNTLLALQLAVILALAAASYRFVEVPCRSGALGRAWDQWRAGKLPAQTRRTTVRVAAGLAVLAVFAAIVYQPPKPITVQAAARGVHRVGGARVPMATVTTFGPSPLDAGVATTVASASPGPAPTTAPPTTSAAPIQAKVTAIGDSVLLETQDALAAKIADLYFDADVARQTSRTLAAARALRASGKLGDEVVLQVGNNGTITKSQFDQFMDVFASVRRVVIVNIKVPRPWEQANNDVLADGVQRTPKAVLVDWNKLGAAHPDVFENDSVHLTPSGVQLLTDAIVAKL
ncbi:MAG TPA: acyltransferase family protein [Acidimicrobiales bacterium]|nr:acyltransferase family protein [Acidimicrobiales bacterium]